MSENQLNVRKRGFAALDPEQMRLIARMGGKAAAQGNTSRRGFASMDPEKRREIARKGGRAAHRTEGND